MPRLRVTEQSPSPERSYHHPCFSGRKRKLQPGTDGGKDTYRKQSRPDITFGSLSNASLTAGTYQLSATASSGLGVSFASSDNTVAEVSGTTLTLKKGGSIIITASQGGNGTYLAAPNVTQPLTVIDDTQQAQTITWSQTLGTRAFGVADLNLTANTNSGLPITYLSSDSSVASIMGRTMSMAPTSE